MSFINKIPRGLRVLVVMVILAVLVWIFATGTEYFYYSIGLAALLTFGAIVLVYNPFTSSHSGLKEAKSQDSKMAEGIDTEDTGLAGEEAIQDTLAMGEEELPPPAPFKNNTVKQPVHNTPVRGINPKPVAMDVARNYHQAVTRDDEGEQFANRAATRPANMAAGIGRPPTKSAPATPNSPKSSGGITGRLSAQPGPVERPTPASGPARTSSGNFGKTLKEDDNMAKSAQLEAEDDLPFMDNGEQESEVSIQKPAKNGEAGVNFINKIPRGLRVLVVMAVLGVLIWRFAQDTQYFYYSIGAAVLITFGVIVWIYKPFKFQKKEKTAALKEQSEMVEDSSDELDQSEDIPVESDFTDAPPSQRQTPVVPFRDAVGRPSSKPASSVNRPVNQGQRNVTTPKQAVPVTKPSSSVSQPVNQVQKNAVTPKQAAPATKPLSSVNQPLNQALKNTVTPKQAVQSTKAASPNKPVEAEPRDKIVENIDADENDSPAIPLVEDETILTEEDKNLLVNAVWYRCENPYCKYTSFLGVHHIVDEKEGGTNRLDNLIVLCPYCHDLAHRNEIPEEEMHEWISNRENRFKFKINWKYF